MAITMMMNVRHSICQDVDPACLVEEEETKTLLKYGAATMVASIFKRRILVSAKKTRLDGFQLNVGYGSS